jgi:hypothetical protein
MSLGNYRDIGKRGSDMHAGFQFEFHCGNCSRVWQSPFEPYRRGQLAGFFYRFSYFLGDRGTMLRASNAVADAGSGGARDHALQRAIELAEQRYNECPSCQKVVCEDCWDARARLCEPCSTRGGSAPRADRHGAGDEDDRPRVPADDAAQVSARDSGGLKCPNCAAAIDSGRFCGECGFDMASTHKSCPSCGTLCARATRFCTDCGHGF